MAPSKGVTPASRPRAWPTIPQPLQAGQWGVGWWDAGVSREPEDGRGNRRGTPEIPLPEGPLPSPSPALLLTVGLLTWVLPALWGLRPCPHPEFPGGPRSC